MTKAMSVKAYVFSSGPLFNGVADKVIDEIMDEIAKRGADYARDQLRQVVMDKTGRAHGEFQEQLQTVKRDLGYAVPGPMESGDVWAPWLEGVSTRNQRSDFKGYGIFAKERRYLRAGKAQQIADQVVAEMLPALGGE